MSCKKDTTAISIFAVTPPNFDLCCWVYSGLGYSLLTCPYYTPYILSGLESISGAYPSATAYDIFSVECCAQLFLNFEHVARVQVGHGM